MQTLLREGLAKTYVWGETLVYPFALADAAATLVESGAATVLVTANDLPGHIGSLEAGKTVV